MVDVPLIAGLDRRGQFFQRWRLAWVGRGVSVLSSPQVRSEDAVDSISVVEDSDGDLLCRRGIVKLSHCRENLVVGLCLVAEYPFKRADLIHVLSPNPGDGSSIRLIAKASLRSRFGRAGT